MSKATRRKGRKAHRWSSMGKTKKLKEALKIERKENDKVWEAYVTQIGNVAHAKRENERLIEQGWRDARAIEDLKNEVGNLRGMIEECGCGHQVHDGYTCEFCDCDRRYVTTEQLREELELEEAGIEQPTLPDMPKYQQTLYPELTRLRGDVFDA